jgi:hypothetical protein
VKSIWKYTLETLDRQVIDVPNMFTPIAVQMQDSKMVLWAVVGLMKSRKSISVRIVCTGDEVNYLDESGYVGTVQLPKNGIVLHVFVEDVCVS